MPKHRGTHDPSPVPTWRFTKVMNMSDLSRDDDFLSHLFVEKLGTGSVPLFVHKMDSSRRLPKTDTNDILQTVRRVRSFLLNPNFALNADTDIKLVAAKAQPSVAVREAVDSLLLCVSCVNCRLLRGFHTCCCTGFDPLGTTSRTTHTSKSTPLPRTQPAQILNNSNLDPLYSHASRYLELYLPNGSIEIAHTSRYAHATGKSELCILATRPLAPGAVITELKGSMADLTDEEDRELKCATATGQFGIRRDFSVIHSKQLKKNHLFLGPARFVNVSHIG